MKEAAIDFARLFLTNDAEYHLRGGQFAVADVMETKVKESIKTLKPSKLRDILSESLNTGDLRRRIRRTSQIHITDPYFKSLPAGDPDGAKMVGCLRSRATVQAAPAYQDFQKRVHTAMADSSITSADRELASRLIDDGSATGNWAYSTVSRWLALPRLGPVEFDRISLPRYFALVINCAIQCAAVAGQTALKLLGTRGVTSSQVASFSARTLASDPLQKDPRSTDPLEDKTIPQAGLIIKYSPNALKDAIDAAQKVVSLRDELRTIGGVVRERGYLVGQTLSGIDWENKRYPAVDRHPFPEHSILIFAEKDGLFLIWDPDSNVTRIPQLGGNGVGLLKYDNTDAGAPTFSTGLDFDDLSKVKRNGDHFRFQDKLRRHRYQISGLTRPGP